MVRRSSLRENGGAGAATPAIPWVSFDVQLKPVNGWSVLQLQNAQSKYTCYYRRELHSRALLTLAAAPKTAPAGRTSMFILVSFANGCQNLNLSNPATIKPCHVDCEP